MNSKVENPKWRDAKKKASRRDSQGGGKRSGRLLKSRFKSTQPVPEPVIRKH